MGRHGRSFGRALHPTLDVVVYTLSSPLPATITPCKVLPANYASYLSYLTVGRPPVMILDKDEHALIQEFQGLQSLDGQTHFVKPPDFRQNRVAFYEPLIDDDSGNPAFLIINGELVLLSCAHDNTSGPFVTNLTNPTTLNDMIAAADADAAVQHPEFPVNPVQVQTIDLSGFSTFTP